MRFEELTLEKYGNCPLRTLSFQGKPGLVIIYGPNEAGKTTSLAAVIDFLFGIPQNSLHGQFFGYDQMRLRATLLSDAGDRFVFVRRKGRGIQKTLYDAENRVVEEARLSRFLGEISRTRFESLFGLSHESLRRGGRQLLDAEGDIGRLIVEAGGGLRFLIEGIERLRQQSDRLFSPRRSADRAFYKAYDAYEAAVREIKESLVTQEAYEKAQRQAQAVAEILEKRKEERRTVDRQRQHLSRLERVVPLLQELDQIEGRQQTFLDLPPLTDDFSDRVGRTLQECKTAEANYDETAQKQEELEKQMDECPVMPEFSEAEPWILEILEKAVQVKKERADRPKRQAELREREEKLHTLRRLVGAGAETDLEALLPSQPVLNAVRGLLTQGAELGNKIATLKDQIENEETKREKLESRQKVRTESGQDKPPGMSAGDFSDLPGQHRTLEAKRKQIEQLDREIAERLDELGFAGAKELQSFPCPDAAVVRAEMEKVAALEQRRMKQEENLAKQKAVLGAALAEIEWLQREGELPTEAAILAARSERREAWEPIRMAYLEDGPVETVPVPIERRMAAVAGYEEQVRKADSLVDRKSLEAQRIASLELQEKRREEAQALIVAETESLRQVEEEIYHSRQVWNDTWPQAAGKEGDLARLQRLLDEREAVLDRVKRVAEFREEAERLHIEWQGKMEALLQVEAQFAIQPEAKAGLALRIRNATQAMQMHEAAHQAFLHEAELLLDVRDQLRRNASRLKEWEGRWADWKREWEEAMPKIVLPQESAREQVEEVLGLWAEAGGILDTIRMTRKRLQRMDEDERELQDLVERTALHLGLNLPKDSLAAAKMIQDRSDANKQRTTERNSLAAQLKGVVREKERKKKSLEAANEVLSGLCLEAACEEKELSSIAERQSRYLEEKRLRLQALEKIAGAGDGKSVEELREEWGGKDLDHIRAESKFFEEEEERIHREIEEAAGNVRDQQRLLDGFLSAEGINRAVAEREWAAAEIRRIVEEYIETAMTKEVLDRAMDKIRHEQQNPLLERAGRLFALTTRGAFTGIDTDVDGKEGRPIVVGKRASGETVGLEIMSDGTRDQLFLAFRLADIEQYCASAEPLPFVADDLLVHFDEERSAATLDLLAEIGKKTQVLLFAHHRRVVELAEEKIREGTAGLLPLA